MLRTKFFNGLLPHLRHGIRHTFDKVKDFDQLLVATRKIEESKLKTDPESNAAKSRKGQVKMAKATEDDSTAVSRSH